MKENIKNDLWELSTKIRIEAEEFESLMNDICFSGDIYFINDIHSHIEEIKDYLEGIEELLENDE